MVRSLLLVLIAYAAHGQAFLANPSFEGSPGAGVPPPSWISCLPWSTPDTQPGTWEITLPASNGNTYVSLVTRGMGGYPNDGLSEAIGTALLNPFQPNVCYLISIDVAFFPKTTWSDNGIVIVYDTPSILNVWSSNNDCAQKNLLFRSNPISNTQWQTLTIPITPSDPITHLMFHADYNQGNIKYGNILIDNIRIEQMSVDLGSDAVLCNGQSKQLSVNVTNANILWNTGAQTNTITASETGIYSVTVEKNGCVLKGAVNISILKKLEKFLPTDTTLCPGDILTLDTTTPLGKTNWNTGWSNPIMQVYVPGNYVATIDNGCEIKNESIKVDISPDYCCNLSMPNVFTPNDDLKNDLFEISSHSEISAYHLVIYNRWGQSVFTTNNLMDSWDGKTDGKVEAAAGIYYWTANVHCDHLRKRFSKDYRGTVTLLR